MKKSTGITLLIAFVFVIVGVSMALSGYFIYGGQTLVKINEKGLSLADEPVEVGFSTKLDPFTEIEIVNAPSTLQITEGEDFSLSYETGPRRMAKNAAKPQLKDFARVESGKLILERLESNTTSTDVYVGLSGDIGLIGTPDDYYPSSETVTITVPKGSKLSTINIEDAANTVNLDHLNVGVLKSDADHANTTVLGGSYGEILLPTTGGTHIIQDGTKVAGLVKIESNYGEVRITDAEIGSLELKTEGFTGIKNLKVAGLAKVEQRHSGINMVESSFAQGLELKQCESEAVVHGDLVGKIVVDADENSQLVMLTSRPESDYSILAKVDSEGGILFYNEKRASSEVRIENAATTNSIEIDGHEGRIALITGADSTLPGEWEHGQGYSPYEIDWYAE